MDENKKLFVCENGVLDLELGIFRDGRPDDYCTFSCNQYYRPYTKEDDEWKELKIFFRKVFPDRDLRRYFKDSTCAILEGGNKNKVFIVGTGGGDNAKSVTHKLLELMFGEYHLKFPQEMLIKGRGNSSSSARPELARVRGKRIAIIQEIAKDETLNIGVLKELTGNDSFYARTLFEKGTEIQPGFTLLMQCNEPPAIPGHDDATWNRVRRLDYESRFVKPRDLHKFPVPASEEEQMKMKRFHADLSFMDRVPELVPVLLSMFFKRYVEKYKKFGLREPQKVQMATGMYRAMNDVFVQFIQDKIEEVEYPKGTADSEKVFIKLADVHAEFTSWYKETHSSYSKEKFDRHILAHELNKRLNGSEKRGRQQIWIGYRICEDDDGVTDKDSQLHQMLSKKIEPKIKKVDAAEIGAKVSAEVTAKPSAKVTKDAATKAKVTKSVPKKVTKSVK
jgi:phage/plasmid-associated DNA primase